MNTAINLYFLLLRAGTLISAALLAAFQLIDTIVRAVVGFVCGTLKCLFWFLVAAAVIAMLFAMPLTIILILFVLAIIGEL